MQPHCITTGERAQLYGEHQPLPVFSQIFSTKKSEKIYKEKSEKNGSIFSQIFCPLLSPGPLARSCPHCQRAAVTFTPLTSQRGRGQFRARGPKKWPLWGARKLHELFRGSVALGTSLPVQVHRQQPLLSGLVLVDLQPQVIVVVLDAVGASQAGDLAHHVAKVGHKLPRPEAGLHHGVDVRAIVVAKMARLKYYVKAMTEHATVFVKMKNKGDVTMTVKKRLVRRAGAGDTEETLAKKAEIRQLMINCDDKKFKTVYEQFSRSNSIPFLSADETILFGDEIENLVDTTTSKVNDFVDYYVNLMNAAAEQNLITYVWDFNGFSGVMDQLDHIGDDDQYILKTFSSIDEVLKEIDDEYLEDIEEYYDEVYKDLLEIAKSGDVVKFVDAANELFNDMAYNGTDEVLICKGCKELKFITDRTREDAEYEVGKMGKNPKYMLCEGPSYGMGGSCTGFDSKEELVDHLMKQLEYTYDLDKLDAIIEMFK